jgi:hypothetical protein
MMNDSDGSGRTIRFPILPIEDGLDIPSDRQIFELMLEKVRLPSELLLCRENGSNAPGSALGEEPARVGEAGREPCRDTNCARTTDSRLG